ncbi:MAG: PorT family protein, partial [Muribaculaceae bacterium]|nr:PorT family protein [Muribaculaceae bacterium]
AASAVSAQNLLLANPDNEAYLGARIGVDLTSTSGPSTNTYNNGAGFSIGAVYNIPVWQNLYVEPGLSFFYNTFSEDIIRIPSEDAPGEVPVEQIIPRSIRNFGFRIPLLAGYHFDFTDMVKISVFTGPQLNISLYAHDHIKKLPDVDETLEVGSLFGQNGFKHWDLQWVFGASVAYDRYVFSVQGGVGMTRVFNKTYTPAVTDKLRRNTCTISLGYNF